jgi:hypothetical protein
MHSFQQIPLSLDHQETLSSLWKPLCLEQDLKFAEYSFANIFLFRRTHHTAFVESSTPFVKGVFGPDDDYLTPTCLPSKLNMQVLKDMNVHRISFFPIPDQWLPDFEKFHLQKTANLGDSDYIFKADKLKTLSGRNLSSRRNLLHQLESNYSVECKVLGSSELADALVVLEKWQSHQALSKEENDYWPCRDALEYLERLGLFGRIAYADGQPIGFAIGEYLTPKTVHIHLMKTLVEFKGVTPYLYQDFAKHLEETVEWIDLEQDLGIPSLRQAKTAYDPDILLTKWRVGLTKKSV